MKYCDLQNCHVMALASSLQALVYIFFSPEMNSATRYRASNIANKTILAAGEKKKQQQNFTTKTQVNAIFFPFFKCALATATARKELG